MKADEYLEFITRNFYAQYVQHKITLSVYNCKQQLMFFTDQLAKIAGFSSGDLYRTLDELAERHSGTAVVAQIFRDAFAKINLQALSVSSIYHGFRDGFFHVVLYQIEGIVYQDEICGYSCKSTNLTAYFLNRTLNFPANQPKKQITKEQIDQLSKRELQVLFLLMLNLKQTEIATMLSISSGNISKTINHVCSKLIDSSSSRILLTTYDCHQVVSTIANTIDIHFKPIIWSHAESEANLGIIYPKVNA